MYVHSKMQRPAGQGKLHGKPRSARVTGLPLGSMDATTIGCGNRSGAVTLNKIHSSLVLFVVWS